MHYRKVVAVLAQRARANECHGVSRSVARSVLNFFKYALAQNKELIGLRTYEDVISLVAYLPVPPGTFDAERHAIPIITSMMLSGYMRESAQAANLSRDATVALLERSFSSLSEVPTATLLFATINLLTYSAHQEVNKNINTRATNKSHRALARDILAVCVKRLPHAFDESSPGWSMARDGEYVSVQQIKKASRTETVSLREFNMLIDTLYRFLESSTEDEKSMIVAPVARVLPTHPLFKLFDDIMRARKLVLLEWIMLIECVLSSSEELAEAPLGLLTRLSMCGAEGGSIRASDLAAVYTRQINCLYFFPKGNRMQFARAFFAFIPSWGTGEEFLGLLKPSQRQRLWFALLRLSASISHVSLEGAGGSGAVVHLATLEYIGHALIDEIPNPSYQCELALLLYHVHFFSGVHSREAELRLLKQIKLLFADNAAAVVAAGNNTQQYVFLNWRAVTFFLTKQSLTDETCHAYTAVIRLLDSSLASRNSSGRVFFGALGYVTSDLKQRLFALDRQNAVYKELLDALQGLSYTCMGYTTSNTTGCDASRAQADSYSSAISRIGFQIFDGIGPERDALPASANLNEVLKDIFQYCSEQDSMSHRIISTLNTIRQMANHGELDREVLRCAISTLRSVSSESTLRQLSLKERLQCILRLSSSYDVMAPLFSTSKEVRQLGQLLMVVGARLSLERLAPQQSAAASPECRYNVSASDCAHALWDFTINIVATPLRRCPLDKYVGMMLRYVRRHYSVLTSPMPLTSDVGRLLSSHEVELRQLVCQARLASGSQLPSERNHKQTPDTRVGTNMLLRGFVIHYKRFILETETRELHITTVKLLHEVTQTFCSVIRKHQSVILPSVWRHIMIAALHWPTLFMRHGLFTPPLQATLNDSMAAVVLYAEAMNNAGTWDVVPMPTSNSSSSSSSAQDATGEEKVEADMDELLSFDAVARLCGEVEYLKSERAHAYLMALALQGIEKAEQKQLPSSADTAAVERELRVTSRNLAKILAGVRRSRHKIHF